MPVVVFIEPVTLPITIPPIPIDPPPPPTELIGPPIQDRPLPSIPFKNDKAHWISQPQLIRWRNRYRGSIESYKINLETQQILYDLRRIYEKTTDTGIELESDFSDIETGTSIANLSYYWESTNFTGPVTISGTQDIIRRIDALRTRVELLETHGWNIQSFAFNGSL